MEMARISKALFSICESLQDPEPNWTFQQYRKAEKAEEKTGSQDTEVQHVVQDGF